MSSPVKVFGIPHRTSDKRESGQDTLQSLSPGKNHDYPTPSSGMISEADRQATTEALRELSMNDALELFEVFPPMLEARPMPCREELEIEADFFPAISNASSSAIAESTWWNPGCLFSMLVVEAAPERPLLPQEIDTQFETHGMVGQLVDWDRGQVTFTARVPWASGEHLLVRFISPEERRNSLDAAVVVSDAVLVMPNVWRYECRFPVALTAEQWSRLHRLEAPGKYHWKQQELEGLWSEACSRVLDSLVF